MRRTVFLGLALAACLYALIVLWYAQGTNEIGLTCAFETHVQKIYEGYIPPELNPEFPRHGDQITRVGQRAIRSWSDFLRTLADLSDAEKYPRWDVPADAPRANLEELSGRSTHVVRRGDQELVRVELARQEDGTPYSCWCVVGSPPLMEFVHSLVWLAVKLTLFGFIAVVLWKRPNHEATFRFFLLCVVTIGAFMGGYHWLRIASCPPLVLIFMICAVLLPVVSLHFYLSFPRPKQFLRRFPKLTLGIMYGIPVTLLLIMIVGYLAIVWTYRHGYDADTVIAWSNILLREIYTALVVSALLFLGCVVSLAHSFFSSRADTPERNQVKWILTGALVATIPISYTLFLAATDTDTFGMGGATWPMFAASLCFTLAYGISISRYGLMEVEQVVNWGIVTIAVGLVAGLVYSGLVFLGALLISSRIETHSWLRQAAWVSLTAWLLLLGLDLFRWRVRKAIDRKLHREKYQLERTLRQMSAAVEQMMDAPTLSQRFLHALAELLGFEKGAVYLREGELPLYRLVTHLGGEPPLTELPTGSPLINALTQSPLVRLRAGPGPQPEPAQRQLALLQAEIAVPLRHEGNFLAVLLVGARTHGSYQADEIHLLTTFSQIAALALQGAQGHQAMDRLNRELRAKVEKISEQQRRIVALQSQLRRQVQPPADSEAKDVLTAGIVGSSIMLQNLLQVVRKVAASPSAVLIRGESGTGKELFARALHENSPRTGKPFVKVHCAALSPGLLESELFGHVKGAFTGAHRDKVGRFELANSGTLFLDEIGDIGLEVQTKLLRVLQEMTFERVGSSEPIQVDVRLIAATNQNLEQLMRQGRFREDLFYRLNVIAIRTPPLRERREDIYELVWHFLRLYSERSSKVVSHIDDEALEILKAYDWPGNVRELENVIERAVVLADGPTITVHELPDELIHAAENGEFEGATADHGSDGKSRLGPDLNAPEEDWSSQRERNERDRLVRALAAAAGNKTKAARSLGMPRSTFISKLEKYGLLPRRV